MQTHFEKDLVDLKTRLLTMASHAEAAVRDAVQALVARDESLAQKVKEQDDIIDRFELELDELAIRFLARAPLATDLRLITVAMKVSQNLERVGDEATKIARRAFDLASQPPLKDPPDVVAIANIALQLLKTALDSFVNNDPAAARGVIPQDKGVDELNKRMQRQLVEKMQADPETITRCLDYIVVVKSIERIADHAKNVAEEVVYLCEAHDIRHSGKSQALVA